MTSPTRSPSTLCRTGESAKRGGTLSRRWRCGVRLGQLEACSFRKEPSREGTGRRRSLVEFRSNRFVSRETKVTLALSPLPPPSPPSVSLCFSFRATQIKTYSWDNAQVIMVGNKCDLEDDRIVPTEDSNRLAEDLGEGGPSQHHTRAWRPRSLSNA